MTNYKLRQSSEVFRAYFSGVLRISEHSLSTLEVACCHCPLPEPIPQFAGHEVEPAKLTLLKLLFSKENCADVFSCDIFARVCVALTLKKFPMRDLQKRERPTGSSKSIEELFEATCMEGGLLIKKEQGKRESKTVNSVMLEKGLLDELMTLLVNSQKDALADENADVAMLKLTRAIVLDVNILSYLFSFSILKIEDCEECVLIKSMLEAIEKLTHQVKNVVAKIMRSRESHQIAKFKEFMKLFERLFQTNIVPEFSYRLREIIPVPLLQSFFDLMDMQSKEEADCSDLRILSARIVTQYCCVPGLQKMSQNQKFALETLLPDNFNAESPLAYDLVMKISEFIQRVTHFLLAGCRLSVFVEILRSWGA